MDDLQAVTRALVDNDKPHRVTFAEDRAEVFAGWLHARFRSHARSDVPALVAALRAVLEEIDKRGKQAREALPPSLAALAVPSYQFNVRASDVIRAIEEALS